MKKRIAMLLALMMLFISSPLSEACAQLLRREAEGVFILPSSLQFIDEEAFAGTAVETVVAADALQRIADRAFADTSILTAVFLP